MYPTTFHKSERVLSPPSGQHEEMAGLRVLDVTYRDGSQGCISCWKLEPEEAEELKKSGEIYLAVLSPNQPPVFLTTSLTRLGVTQ